MTVNTFVPEVVRAEHVVRQASRATDAELLDLFVTRGRQDAFAELVRRHGPVVLGVCSRGLANRHDAQDAFQVTFMVLASKAASLRRPELLGNWLYGVACRVAKRARVAASRRRNAEGALMRRLESNNGAKTDGRESHLQAFIDEEIDRLPPQYRAALVAVYIEGRTNREAARRLGWPEGTLVTRLNRAKSMLRRRAAARGAAEVEGGLRRRLSPAVVPAAWVAATARLASRQAAGKSVASLASARVAKLFNGFAEAGAMAKSKVGGALLIVACVTGVAIAVFGVGNAAAKPVAREVVEYETRPAAGVPREGKVPVPAAVVPALTGESTSQVESSPRSAPAVYGFTDNAGTAADVLKGLGRATDAASRSNRLP